MMKYMRWESPTIMGQTPTIKNHTATLVDNRLYIFGGYDGHRNHSTVHVLDCDTYTWRICDEITGKPPAGRNGHTATLADHTIFFIGGWLGSGPLAAADTHILDVEAMHWVQPVPRGSPPGACNMHTADFIPRRRQIFVFRGGDGSNYLNDLHGLHVDTHEWLQIATVGESPVERANHASAVDGDNLFIFGGWDGHKRLNDIHMLDTSATPPRWSTPRIHGTLPHPRAGMTFTWLREQVFLFGGSGASTKCFNDVQIFEPSDMAWMDTVSAAKPMPSSILVASSSMTSSLAAEGESFSALSPESSHQPPPSTSLRGSQDQEPRPADSEALEKLHPRYDSADSQLEPALSHLEGLRLDDLASTPNPNDAHGPPTKRIVILGQGPGRRAGHTATVVNRRLLIFGGSYGSEYLNDFFVLDTDPTPETRVTAKSSLQTLTHSLRNYSRSSEFSDVTFLVEHRPVHAHRVVLSAVSERFRAMFSDGFRESSEREIVIPDMSHAVFTAMLDYLYTGQPPRACVDASEPGFPLFLELLECADQYMLDHLKQICETRLATVVAEETVDILLEAAERNNAWQLGSVCQHFLRNCRFSAEGCAPPDHEPTLSEAVASTGGGTTTPIYAGGAV
uniref:BTB domain-containing protein n=1 Tax=Rhizochromulina marina TaxID=1034831 RepID=A0A7S2W4I0_9STRA